MKKSEIVIAAVLIGIIAAILILIFFGLRIFDIGELSRTVQQSPANATLWEKAEWVRYHGNVCQCSPAFELSGTIQLTPSTYSSISKISFNVSPIPGTTGNDIKNSTFTVSTKNTEKTIHYRDPAVNLTCFYRGTAIRKKNFSENNPEINGDSFFIELDLQKMGFTSPGLGPDERFSLIITPPTGYRFAITRSTPSEFSPGKPVEIPGWH
ncbi:MAG: hypothetical protein WC379_10140 [Methanoregula sp.]